MGRPTSLLAHYLFLTSRRPNPCFLLRGPSPRTAARAWPAALRDPLASCDRSAPRRAFHWRFTDLWGPSVIRSDRFFPNDVRGPCGRIAGFRLKRWSSGIKLTLRLPSSLSLYCTPTPRPPCNHCIPDCAIERRVRSAVAIPRWCRRGDDLVIARGLCVGE
jgi:hypothetical protein